MNRKYLTPKIEIAYIDIESHIATGSAPAKPGDSYSITNDGDKWHQDGGIQNGRQSSFHRCLYLVKGEVTGTFYDILYAKGASIGGPFRIGFFKAVCSEHKVIFTKRPGRNVKFSIPARLLHR